jgi:MoxR-like ATPase
MTFEQAVVNANKVNEAICASMIDREVEVTLGMIALISKQHLFLLGKPGTAKTMGAYLLGQSLGGSYFEKLLSRFTVPAEMFGPLSVKKFMEQELYETNVAGFLPDVRLGLADEIWKASSAILNSLLTIINERVYHNGAKRIKVPLETLIGCSNELPEDDGLNALYDRFMVRHEVHRIPESHRGRLLLIGDPTPPPAFVGLPTLQAAQQTATVPDNVQAGLLALVKVCLAAGIEISDRRIRHSVSLVRAHAVLHGRQTCEMKDLAPLQYCFWQTPDQIPQVSEHTAMVISGRSPTASPPAIRPLPVGGAAPRGAPVPQQSSATTAAGQGPKPAGQPGQPVQPPGEVAAKLAQMPTAGIYFQANGIVMTSSSNDNVSNAWLHAAIDTMLARSDLSEQNRETITNWKITIQKHLGPIGMGWLGQA